MVLLTFRTNGSSYHRKAILDSVRPVRLDSFLGDLFHPGPLVLLRQGGGLLYFVCLLAESPGGCVLMQQLPLPCSTRPCGVVGRRRPVSKAQLSRARLCCSRAGDNSLLGLLKADVMDIFSLS